MSSSEEEDDDWADSYQPRKKQRIDLEVDTALKATSSSKLTGQKPAEMREWLDRFVPTKIEELFVHKKKIEELYNWFTCLKNRPGLSGRILLVTGPSGCGKMITVKLVCKKLKYSVVEWINSESQNGELRAFAEFAVRATRYNSVFVTGNNVKIILIKDIPNVFLRDSQLFHECLRKYASIDNINMVFIISDSIIARDLFPEDLRSLAHVSTINFNAVTQRGVASALRRISKLSGERFVEKFIDQVSESSEGDLRRAILALHFLSANRCREVTTVSEVSNDDHLELFRGLGRVLYAKRNSLNAKLVHNPLQVAETFEHCSSLFIDMIRENYLSIYSMTKDVSVTSCALASTELMLSDWREAPLSRQYALAAASIAAAENNTAPVKRFHQFRRCRQAATFDAPKYRDRIRANFSTFHERDFLVDVRCYFRSTRASCSEAQSKLLYELSFQK